MYTYFKKNLLKSLIRLKNNWFFLIQDAQPLFFNRKLNLTEVIPFDLTNFGTLNKNKVFYVIKRSPGAGLFSNVIYVLNHLIIAENNNFFPVIDMKNFTTIYNEKNKINGNYNSWEYYFNKVSKFNLNEVYSSQNVIITKNRFYSSFSNIISNDKFRKIGKKYFEINNKYKKEAEKYHKKFLNNKTLAIHYRGTSYKTSANHPFPATIDQTINYCEHLIKKFNYKKIFLCTEDLKLLIEMKKKFGHKLFFLKNSYRSYKDDAFKKYPRKLHRFNLGKEILIESLIISKCSAFLHAKTNVSEFIKFLDKYNNIKYFNLSNGFNTSNEYLAPYLWYYKNLVPEVLGGFKKNKNL